MNKVAVVYWSGTGNTEAMAKAVLQGIQEKGAEGELFSCEQFNADMVKNYDALAFGCPAMGDEALEDTVFEPMFNACSDQLKGKKVALFGSYGWGVGDWMKNWEEQCEGAGIRLAEDSVICNDKPNDEAILQCKDLGAALA